MSEHQSNPASSPPSQHAAPQASQQSSPSSLRNVSFTSSQGTEATEREQDYGAAASFAASDRRPSRPLDVNTILNPTPSPHLRSPISRRRSAAHLGDPEGSPSTKRRTLNSPDEGSGLQRSVSFTREPLPRTPAHSIGGPRYYGANENPFPGRHSVSSTVPQVGSPLRSPVQAPGVPHQQPPPPLLEAFNSQPPSAHTLPRTIPPLFSGPPGSHSALSSLNASPVSNVTAYPPPQTRPPLTPVAPVAPHYATGGSLGAAVTPQAGAGLTPAPAIYPGAPGYGAAPSLGLPGIQDPNFQNIKLVVDDSGAGSRESNTRRARNAQASSRFRARQKYKVQQLKDELSDCKAHTMALEDRITALEREVDYYRSIVAPEQHYRPSARQNEPVSSDALPAQTAQEETPALTAGYAMGGALPAPHGSRPPSLPVSRRSSISEPLRIPVSEGDVGAPAFGSIRDRSSRAGSYVPEGPGSLSALQSPRTRPALPGIFTPGGTPQQQQQQQYWSSQNEQRQTGSALPYSEGIPPITEVPRPGTLPYDVVPRSQSRTSNRPSSTGPALQGYAPPPGPPPFARMGDPRQGSGS